MMEKVPLKDKVSSSMREELYQAFTLLSSAQESQVFLEDLMTPQEEEKLSQRLRAARLLLEGKTYEDVIAATKISSTTLSRVSKAIRYGDGGYRIVIARMKNDDVKK